MNICWHQTVVAIGPKPLLKPTQCCFTIAQAACGRHICYVSCSSGEKEGVCGRRRPETTLKPVSNIFELFVVLEWCGVKVYLEKDEALTPKRKKQEWIDTKKSELTVWQHVRIQDIHSLPEILTIIFIMAGLTNSVVGYSASQLKSSQFYVWLFTQHCD